MGITRITGRNPNNIFDLRGINGSNLSGVKNSTKRTSSGYKANTMVLTQISAGMNHPGPTCIIHTTS